MKKLLLLLAILLLVSCGKKEDKTSKTTAETTTETIQDTAKNLTVVEEIKGPKIKLHYKFKKGATFTYKLKTIANNKSTITADTVISNNIKQSATYTIKFKVKNVNKEDNLAELEANIRKIIAETSMNGQTLKYDSKYIYSTRERAQFVDFEAVKKIPFRVFVNQIGQVVKVEKVNRIMRNILQIQQIPDTLSKKTKERMRNNIANGTLMPLVQQVFKVLSEDEVGVGSFWELKSNAPMAVFQVENTAKFKVDNIDFSADTTINIISSLSIVATGNNTASEKGVTYTFTKPKLTGSGSVVFNQSKGLVKKSESKINVEMEMTAQGVDAQKNPVTSSKKDVSTNINTVELL